MPIDLSGVLAKIDRAYEHVQALDREIESFVQRYPYGMRVDSDADGRRKVGYLEIYRGWDDPARFGTIIGDAASNFRSSLDHLVRSVAITTLNKTDFEKWEHRLAYPICTTEELWDKEIAGHRLEGIPEPVRAEIGKRQPYKAGNPAKHYLAVLQWINDRDKHRLVHTVAGFVLPESLNFRPAVPAGSEWNIPKGPHTEDGAELFEVVLPEPIPDMEIQADVRVLVQLRECSITTEDVRETLKKIGAAARAITRSVTNAVG